MRIMLNEDEYFRHVINHSHFPEDYSLHSYHELAKRWVNLSCYDALRNTEKYLFAYWKQPFNSYKTYKIVI